MQHDIDGKILPLIRVKEEIPSNNVIFGSGSFSTGRFQIEQFEKVKSYVDHPPVEIG